MFNRSLVFFPLLLATGVFAQPATPVTPAVTEVAPAVPQLTWGELTPEQKKSLSDQVYAKPQGALIRMEPFVLGSARDLEVQRIIQPGPQYLFSDEPESVKVPEGVLLRENVEAGRVRLYVYHVNGFTEEGDPGRRINSVIKNLGEKPLFLRFTNYASLKPTGNYHRLGKDGLRDFLSGIVTVQAITVEPGATEIIDAKMEEALVKKNDLAHGFYEFLIDQPAEISVVMGAASQSSKITSTLLPEVLPMNNQRNAGRGLFGVSNYYVTLTEPYDTTMGLANIPMAVNTTDPWVRGLRDHGAAVIDLKGNYGVVYEVDVEYTSPDGKAVALVTWNSRAGGAKNWCGGMASTLRTSEGRWPAGLIQVPSDELNVKTAPEAVVIQVFPATEKGETKTARFTFSPTGASCLPMPLLLMPVDAY